MAYDRELATALDTVLLQEPGVTTRDMFGAHAYLVEGRMFCFVMRTEVVLKPRQGDEPALREEFAATPMLFSSGRRFGRFLAIPCGERFEFVGFVRAAIGACEALREAG